LGAKDAGFRTSAQWIIWPACALVGHAKKEFAMPELAISAEKVGFLIEKAREFDVKDVTSDPDSGSNGCRRRHDRRAGG
jgi:hypothetical protein